uniref:Uncharacterized protein n=1 Tax=Pyricularia oryzae (strain P131) TaxID=1143193 RepID=L7JL43_PYRO1
MAIGEGGMERQLEGSPSEESAQLCISQFKIKMIIDQHLDQVVRGTSYAPLPLRAAIC